jgi:hypothetical protein
VTSILQAWLSVVGSTAGGVGIQKTVLSWQVGGGLLGAQSPTCECYNLEFRHPHCASAN